MNDIQARQKLLKIDIDDSSDDEETSSSPIKKSQKQPTKQNPEKDLISETKGQYQAFAEKQQPSQQVTNRDFKGVRYQSLRRNKSFKVKKSQQTSDKAKPIFNKSISKFANIFQEAQEIQLRSSSKFAVHQQQKKEQSLNQELTVKSSFLKTSQFDVVLNAQQSPVLKISNQIKTLSKKNEHTKKQLKLTQQLDSKGKFMKKSAYLEKPIKQLLDRKLSSGIESRSTSRTACQKQIKARLRTQEISDMSSFVHKKIGSLQVLMSVIKKDSSGFNWLWPQIRMVDQKSNIHILSAKKKSANTTSNYYISRNQKQIDVQNNQYMGKVRSNFLGSCFNIFNQGINPQNVDKNEKNTKNVRQILATVIYQSQIANANPKTMRVYMVKAPYSYYDLEGTSIKEEQRNLEKLYQVGMNRNKIHVFKNRKAFYNKRQNRFVLNFDGRIKQPSTKNFILEDSQSKKQVLMFGKITEQEYLLHLSSPLTPHIGLGIVLAELDSKIVCD